MTADQLHTEYIDNYLITIYLKYAQTSADHRNNYSVQGWYYYSKYKTEIPLRSIYYLYIFENPDKCKKVIGIGWQSKPYLNFRYYVNYYKNLAVHKKKLTYSIEYKHIGAEVIINKWTDTSNKLSVMITTSYTVFTEEEYLKVGIFENYIKLSDYPSARNFKLINSPIATYETKVLLSYDYTGQAYELGMYGAGNESGYLLLNFNKIGNLLEMKNSTLECCKRGFFILCKIKKQIIVKFIN